MNDALKTKSIARLDFNAMQKNATEAVTLLKSLANENRLMIVCVLTEGELSVGQINKQIPLSQSALSQHLAVLREQGLVKTRRESQTIYYRLSESPAMSVIGLLYEVYCEA